MPVRRQLAAITALMLGAAIPLAALPARAEMLEIATDQSPVGLDPHVATSFATFQVISNIYEGLTAIDKDLRVVPALAESWTISPDGLTYVFRLRSGLRFHNGRVVTSRDVIANFERVRAPATGSPLASRLAGIASMDATGPLEVTIKLNAPSAPFLSQVGTIGIVAPEAIGNLGREPVGTGPFRFKEWVPDTDIVLERNIDYWAQGLPKLDGLKFDIVPESATREAGIEGGTYKMLPVVDPLLAAGLQNKPGVQLLQTHDLAYSLIGVNTSRPPFDKPAVREAMNMALNRGQIVQAIYFRRGVPAGPLSPALTQWALPTSDFPCYRPDPAAAQKKLAEAGLTGKVAFTLNVLGSLQTVVDLAQVVQVQLNKAGFDVKLNVQEQGKFIADWRASNFDAFISLNSGGVDPDDYFGRTFQTGGATNVFKYSNPEVDKLLIAGRTETDPAKRKPIYDQAQRILACQGPVMHIAYGGLMAAVRNDVKGFAPLPTRSLSMLRETSLGQ